MTKGIEPKKQRVEYIDCLKGCLVILTIVGHIFGKGFLCKWIYSFHMPAFFIISGILLNSSRFLKMSMLDAVISRVKSLLFPYVFFESMGGLVDYWCNGYSLNPFGYIYNSLTFNYNNNVDWFLISLFVAEMTLYLLNRYIKNNQMIQLLVALAAILSLTVLIKKSAILSQSGVALFFLAVGFFGKKYLDKMKGFFYFTVSACISVIVSYINDNVGIYTLVFGNRILYIIGALAGYVSIAYIANLAVKWKIVGKIGRYSIIIMGTQLPIIKLTYQIFPDYIFWQNILRFCCVMGAELTLVYAMEEYKRRPWINER